MTHTDNGFSATRRLILQGAGAVALVGLGNLPFGLAPAFAAANDKYPEEAFKQKSEADAIKSLYGKTRRGFRQGEDGRARDRRERRGGAGLGHDDAGRRDLDLVPGGENPVALVASYKIPAGTMPSVANRIKMAKTSNVIVVVEAGGKLYSATKEVKVTVGGCGG